MGVSTDTNCIIYHSDGRNKIVSSEEANRLLDNKEWFDSPRKAQEYKYLFEVTRWTVEQASCLLCGYNPTCHEQFTKEAKHIDQLIDNDYVNSKILLNETSNITNEKKFIAPNHVFIEWAMKRKISIS